MESMSARAFLISSGIPLPLMIPVLVFFAMSLEKASPSDPRTVTMRPTVHAAWFAITWASQRPTISMSALHTSATMGAIMANSVYTEAREEATRLFARAIRGPSFLVSHLSKIASWKPRNL